jgi:hypothetical protein
MTRTFLALLFAAALWIPERAPFALSIEDIESSVSSTYFSSSTTWNYTPSIAPDPGDLVVLCYTSANESRTIVSITDNLGHTYADAITRTHSGALANTASIRYAIVTGAPSTITTTVSGTHGGVTLMSLFVIKGHSATPFDDAVGADLAGTAGQNHSSGSLVTSSANSVLVGCTHGSTGTYTKDALFTGSSTSISAFGARIVGSAGSYSMTNTSTANEDSQTVLAAFSQAAASTGGGSGFLLGGIGVIK